MKKPKVIPNYKNLFYITFYMLLIFTMVIIGGTCNSIATETNGGLMPVYSEYEWTSERHFGFIDKNLINHWYLTDIIPIPGYMASIGDFLMIIGMFFHAILLIITFYFLFTKRLGKREEIK